MTKYLQSFVLHIIANAAGIYLIDYAVEGFCVVTDPLATSCPAVLEIHWIALIIAAVALAFINGLIKPVLKLISLPFVFLSMGLFMFIINAVVLGIMIWLVNAAQIENVHFLITGDTWVTYLYAAVILGLFNLVTHWLVKIR